MRKRLVLILLVTGLAIAPIQPTYAFGKKPVLEVICGQIIGGYDQNGRFGLFKPDVTVKYYGRPLTVTAYFYATPRTTKAKSGKTITKITGGKSANAYFVDKLDFERKILTYSQPQTGYYKIVFEAIDTSKRKTTFTCLYKDYYF
jgi:hypothetical protein